MSLPKLHVAVLMGGWSNERPVSLMSGEGVATALAERGHRVTRIDMDRDVAARLAEAAPDVVFNALHGTPGEDGTVQGMMDLMGLTYTHSGMVTSVIAIDKELTKQALVPHGIPMPGGRIVETREIFERDPLARPYVLKPVNEGSSVGVAIVTDEGNYGNPIARGAVGPWGEFEELLAEPYVRGRELTTAVLGDRLQHIGTGQRVALEQVFTRDDPPAGHRDAVRDQRILRKLLVDGDDRGGEAGVGVGEAHQVHHALHGAVFARHTVERVEHDIGRRLRQPRRHLPVHVDPGHAVPARLERLGDAFARHQRHRPFVRPPAHEDGDMEFSAQGHGLPTLCISHSRPTPLCA